MKEISVVGVDVSKATLDIFVKPFALSLTIPNDRKGFAQWWTEMKQIIHPDTTIMVVMEHTGMYSSKFESFLKELGVGYCKIPALEIKRSLGMTRGKNDKIDAERIAGYGWLRRDILTADPQINEAIDALKHLLNLRLKLVRDRAGYVNRIKEMKSADCLVSMEQQKRIVAFLTQEIQAVEVDIKAHIKAHPELQKTFELLVSIKGVGPIIAAYMIGNTHNFKRFSNARKFNCYAGIAPFPYQSGTSLKGRSRVSHLANKDTKTLLNLAAICAVQFDEELKNYYQRKIEEGKNKMSCINAIRAKIVARMFAVVKRQSPFMPLKMAA
ncbi:MAG TPA: IS110 family transposase [Chitinophagaceae bacterium]|nr:IS110 family transposase [Chitinophagaceae bacterium]